MTNSAIPFDEYPMLTPSLARTSLLKRSLSGLLAGVVGGVVFGGLVPPLLHWSVHLVISALLGMIFGCLIGDKVRSAGAGLVWGEAFGLLWWLVGVLTLVPLVRGVPSGPGLLWSVGAVQTLVPHLLGQIAAYGAGVGYSYYWFARWLMRFATTTGAVAERPLGVAPRKAPMSHAIAPRWVRALIIGGLGGLLGSWVFVWGLVGSDFYSVVAGIVRADSPAVGRLLHYLIGVTIGCSFGLLFDDEEQDAGSGLIYGINYGLLWWLIGPMILLPWLLGQDARPYWTVATIQRFVPSFVGHILYGALVGWFYGLVNQLWRVLFIDSDPLNRTTEGVGPRSLRALLMGQAGGVIGGLLFTLVMAGVGALPRVGSLIGMASPVVGFIVHLVISLIIGAGYGLLFYRKASGYASATALGLIYGWFWWVLGAVTLFALLLRQPVDWSLPAVTALYPSLVGHLLYGAGLAIFYQFLARRYDDDIVPRLRRNRQPSKHSAKELVIARIMPAVWVTILIGVVLPLLMGAGSF